MNQKSFRQFRERVEWRSKHFRRGSIFLHLPIDVHQLQWRQCSSVVIDLPFQSTANSVLVRTSSERSCAAPTSQRRRSFHSTEHNILPSRCCRASVDFSRTEQLCAWKNVDFSLIRFSRTPPSCICPRRTCTNVHERAPDAQLPKTHQRKLPLFDLQRQCML